MIEAKNLIPYLPYSLKVEMEGKKCNVAWMSTKNIAVHRPGGLGEYKKIAWKYASHNIKPILKSITSLKGSEDLQELRELENKDMLLWGINEEMQNSFLETYEYDVTYSVFAFLIKRHYDVFGLIPQGLAVEEKIKEKASTP